jgi:hypothetical protein
MQVRDEILANHLSISLCINRILLGGIIIEEPRALAHVTETN